MLASRPIVIIGNWKMHKTIEEARSFIKELLLSYHPAENTVVGLAVPYTAIYSLSQDVEGTSLLIGAQNMNDATEGAFTGEIAGRMLKDAGAKFVLVGHSERRQLYGEDNALINRKIKRAIEAELQPVLCIGETQEEYEAEQTQSVLETQLQEGLAGLSAEQLHSLILAYEPVWAIGTKHSASPEVAEEAHQFCRNVLKKMFNDDFAQKVVIQYGGSVTSSNAPDLLAEPDVNGLLIGGASLSLESFSQIVNHTYSKNNRKVKPL